MKSLLMLLSILALATSAPAALKTGDYLTPYEIKNVETGKQYCQVCAYGTKPGKIVAFGKLKDETFWADLKKLQAFQDEHGQRLGVFAQVMDSKHLKVIKAAAAKHGIGFPIVVPVERDWDKAYKVRGVSRTIYYGQRDNKIAWVSVGLDGPAASQLQEHLKKDLAG